jgi:hypothetical protein
MFCEWTLLAKKKKKKKSIVCERVSFSFFTKHHSISSASFQSFWLEHSDTRSQTLKVALLSLCVFCC